MEGQVLLQGAALPVADDGHRLAVEQGGAAQDAAVLGAQAVARCSKKSVNRCLMKSAVPGRSGWRARATLWAGSAYLPCASPLSMELQQMEQGGAQRVPWNDGIQEAVLQQIFGALEALGELFADGLLNHPRAGKADQRRRARPA